MFTVKLCRVPTAAFGTLVSKITNHGVPRIGQYGKISNVFTLRTQNYAQGAKSRLGQATRRRTLKEIAMAPAGPGGMIHFTLLAK